MEQDKGQASRPSDTARLLFLGREGEQGPQVRAGGRVAVCQPPRRAEPTSPHSCSLPQAAEGSQRGI